MKKYLFALALSLMALTTQAADVVMAISPYQSKAEAKPNFNRVVELYAQLDLGDSLTVINGMDASPIATLVIPDKPAYKYEKARLKHQDNRKELFKIKAFTKRFGQSPHPVSGAIDAPSILNEISRLFPNSSDIVLMGSTIYSLNSQKGASMVSDDGKIYVPSDALLTEKPLKNPFGTKGRENALRGKRIHWLLPEAFKDSLHASYLTRFWHLYIHLQAGELISFTHNGEAVTRLLLDKAPELPMPYTLNKDGKRHMQAVRTIVRETSMYSKPVTEQPITKDFLDKPHAVGIGIVWTGGKGVDLDIHAKPKTSNKLYFGNTVTRLGKFYRDEVSGNNANGNQYETIEFIQNINLLDIDIGINVYRVPIGTTKVNGSLRLQIGVYVYAMPFTFSVTKGNGGADIDAVMKSRVDSQFSKHFTVIDIVQYTQKNQGV